jgi:hypothetical protein
VHLYGSDGKLEETEITDANGNYSFTVSPDAIYQIRLDNAADYASGGPLHGEQLTVANSDCEHVRDSRAVLPNASLAISAKNYPQVAVDHLVAGQNNNTFNIGFAQGNVVVTKNKWLDECPPDYDNPDPTVGAHPIPTATNPAKPTVTTKKPTPVPTPKKPVTLPTRTVPTTFPNLPATGSNPEGVVLP